MKPGKFQLRIEHLWGLTVLVGIFVFVGTHPIRPYDFWWHITAGREILATGKIPTTDIFSYTEYGQPYPSYQMFWLMEILLYTLYKWGGPALVIFIYCLMISAAYVILFWICKNLSGSWRAAAAGVFFAAALGINDWNVRPQGITFLLASLFFLAMFQYEQTTHWGWLVLFPMGMLIWVNSHGTFVIGLVLASIWMAQRAWEAIKRRRTDPAGNIKQYILVPSIFFGITILACLINPRGPGIINYLTTLTTSNVVQNLVTEWAPPTFYSLMGILFYTGLMGAAVILAISPNRPTLFQIASFLFFGILGLKTSRGSVWFGLVMAPVIAVQLSSIVNKNRLSEQPEIRSGGSKLVNVLFMTVLIMMAVISLPWFKGVLPLPQAKASLISTETPLQATQVLIAMRPSREIFNSISFGSYLIWAAYPQYQVFVDSRIELFSEQVWSDYLQVSNASGDWESLLSAYGVNTLMLSPVDQPSLIKAVETSSQWQLLYQDDTAFLFARQ